MRVWDVHPGYLSRTRLLGEHREIHALWVVITEEKRGYSSHPETMRWRGHLGELYRRHELVVAEMALRGYRHKSPLKEVLQKEYRGSREGASKGPLLFLDRPCRQFGLLEDKYRGTESGRIPLPGYGYAFWAHHKYSVMARGYGVYKEVSAMSRDKGGLSIHKLGEMVEVVYGILEEGPDPQAFLNSWQHVIGYFKKDLPSLIRKEWLRQVPNQVDALRLMVYEKAREFGLEYIEHSTLLSDPCSKRSYVQERE